MDAITTGDANTVVGYNAMTVNLPLGSSNSAFGTKLHYLKTSQVAQIQLLVNTL